MPYYIISTGLSRAAYDRAESYLTEKKARGFSVYFPREQTLIVHAGRRQIVDNPFIPGYAFVEEDDRDPAMIRNCPGVNNIAYGATWYQRMRVDEFVAALKTREVGGFVGGELPETTTKFASGETVRVTDGPFASFNGVFECESGKQRAMFLVSIFGRDCRVELGFNQVQAL